MSEQEEREKVIAEALSWRGTPYRDKARLKGVGCDCLTFLAGVFEKAGFLGHIDIPHYSQQWHLHRKKELYLEGLLKYTVEVFEPKPACIAVWKFGNTFSHGGIIVKWPVIVHSLINRGVHECDIDKAHGIKFTKENELRPVRYFDFWGKK